MKKRKWLWIGALLLMPLFVACESEDDKLEREWRKAQSKMVATVLVVSITAWLQKRRGRLSVGYAE